VIVAVTGGAGFIGANLVTRLAEASGVERVAVLDDFSTGVRKNLAGVECDLVEGSILDAGALDRVVAGADAVVHLAARPSVPRSIEDPVTSHRVNATGTVEVLEAVRRAGGAHVVVASSSSVYGANPTLPKSEELATRPLSPYAASKLATEAYALAWGACYDLPVLAFRFFNVFGPFQPAGHAYAAVVPAFVDAALRGEPLPIHGDGKQSRDFTFVDTVTAVIHDAIRRRVADVDAVNLAFGTRTDLLSLVDRLSAAMGTDLEVRHTDPRPGDVRHSQADSTRLHELFPDVEPVDLDVGLAKTVAWFRAEASEQTG
jgi:UDP-glucose 4-epimerase